MKRFSFLSTIFGLAGLAKAQQWKECVPEAKQPDGYAEAGVKLCSNKLKPALNNQCPVCGAMVPPYRIPRASVTRPCQVLGTQGVTTELCVGQEPPSKEELEAMHLAACPNCNAAFFRRGE